MAGFIVNTQISTEAVAWTLKTFPQLDKVGEGAEYKGGFKFSSGSMKFRKMSYNVARFGGQVGVNFLRPKKNALTQVLHPLPPGEHVAISDKWAYKNSKHLPSVAIRETKRHAENFYRFAANHTEEGNQFLFFTMPTGKRRLKTLELTAGVDKSFEKAKLLDAALVEKFCGGLEVIGLRLELPYDADSRTFHPHFHGLALCDETLSIEDFRASLRHFIMSQGLNSSSCDASIVHTKDIRKVASYIFKPCLAAYTMAQAGHAEEFRFFVANLSKRLVRTKGQFAAFIRSRRPAFQSARTAPARHPHEADRQTCYQNKLEDQIGEHSRETSIVCNQGPPQNVLYGVSQNVALPGGRTAVWSTVENFSPSTAGMTNRFGGVSTVDLVNAAALQRWEENSDSEYSLKEFLRPFAKDILALLDEGNVQYCTISCSAGVIEALREIKAEEVMSPGVAVGPRPDAGIWARIRAATSWLKAKFDEILNRMQILFLK